MYPCGMEIALRPDSGNKMASYNLILYLGAFN